MSTPRPGSLPTLTEVIDLDLRTRAGPLPRAAESVPLESVGDTPLWSHPTLPTPLPEAESATAAVVDSVVQSLAPKLEAWLQARMGPMLESALQEALARAMDETRLELHAELPELVRVALEEARRKVMPHR